MAEGAQDTPDLWESERLASDAIGRLIEFWGFKRNMGRIWTLLHLRGTPLSSVDIQRLLQMSSGAVSMTTRELARWGVVEKVWLPGERREYFAAEGNLWKMIRRVFRERERAEVLDAIDALEEALEFTARKAAAPSGGRTHAAEQGRRLKELLDFARLGLRLLDLLVDEGRVDISPLIGAVLSGGTPAPFRKEKGGSS
ncbi:MAG: ArsR family transcriptional regulator [Myxococcota bacterium]